MLRYLFDENVDTALVAALRRREPDLTIWKIGEPDMLPLGTLDPAILVECELRDLVLITNNRHSMPTHLADHLAAGRHIPGILLINPGLKIGQILNYLILAAYSSLPDEYRDQIQHLSSL